MFFLNIYFARARHAESLKKISNEMAEQQRALGEVCAA
jgi:hypothetical protein